MTERLSPDVRRLLLSVAVGRLGTGLTLPFTLILLHEVRGIPLPTVGLVLAVPGVVGLAAVSYGGTLIDKVGPRPVLRSSLLLLAVAMAGLGFVRTPAQAAVVLLVQGVALGPTFPATSALLSGLVTPRQEKRAFGVQFTVLNAAIGVGALAGAALVDVDRPLTFELLYVTAAALQAVQALLLPAAAKRVRDAEAVAPSYREVLADPTFRRLLLVSLLFALTGYASLDAGLPAYATVVGDVDPSAVALSFTTNTVLIVALQLPVLRLVARWRHTRALLVASTVWAASWLLLGASQAVWSVLVFGALFGLGEVFMAPALQPLVNALATDRLRGRYNALSGSMFSVAFVVSPALSGLLIGLGLGWLWIGGLVGGCALAVVLTLRLRASLTDAQDGLLEAEGEGRLEVVP